jgi:DNA-binding IclR family transcriptional regulator
VLQTIQKIGPVLDLFTVERPEWGVSEVAEAIGLPRSSAHALLSSLVEIGLLQCRARGRYRIGWRIVELSEALRGGVDLRSIAYPVLEELVARHGETAHLAVMERSKVLYIEKILGTHMLNVVGARIGAHLDPHCSAVGKVLLAYRDPAEIHRLVTQRPLRKLTPATITTPAALLHELEVVRQAGVAFDEGEAVPEVHCVAAPVRDELGAVVAAVSLTVPASRFVRARGELQRSVQSAAAEITRGMVSDEGGGAARRLRDDPTRPRLSLVADPPAH